MARNACNKGLGYEQCTTISYLSNYLMFDRITGAQMGIISNGLKTL